MVLEHEIPGMLTWVILNLKGFLAILVVLTVGGMFLGFLRSAISQGPGEAFYAVARTVFTAGYELGSFSLRRMLAMAWLAFKESWRRRVFVVLIVFVAILMFARWFLDAGSDNPTRLFISFVMTATNFLMLTLALFLSSFSLPTDIKHRTIYTIVTKPVRAWEIILGRIVGFTAIGTVLLAIMAVCSYVFVVRGVVHSHEVTEELEEVLDDDGELIGWQGRTTLDSGHRHSFTLNLDGVGQTNLVQGHWHQVERQEQDGKVRVEVGSPVGMLLARVPRYGKLRFLDRTGVPGEPISVGYEWTYRGYYEGGTLAGAIWEFDGITREEYPDGLPLEMAIRVFRTYKGEIERGIMGSLVVRNPNPAKRVESAPIYFEAVEFSPQRRLIPTTFEPLESDGSDQQTLDLFDDLVDEGRIEILVRCEERAQYFGVAQADMYLRAGDNSFLANFSKGYVGIWLQMVLVTCFGVVFSSILSAAVAMIATLATIVLGFFTDNILELAHSVFSGDKSVAGGGPLEAAIRVPNQMNLTREIENPVMPFIEAVDQGIMAVMWCAAKLIPDYSKFSNISYVANGYDIPFDLWAQQCAVTLIYLLVITCIGYFLLKTREIAA